MKDIKEIRKLNSFKYFAEKFSNDDNYDAYKHKIVYYDENANKQILDDLNQIFADIRNKELLDSVNIKSLGYTLGINFIYTKQVIRKYKGIEKTKYIFDRYDLLEIYNFNENTQNLINQRCLEGYKFSGINIMIKTFSSAMYAKSSKDKNTLYPIFPTEKTPYILLLFQDVSFYFAKKKRIPLTIKYLCFLLNLLTYNDYKALLDLIFDVFYDNSYLVKDVKKYISNNHVYYLPIKFNELNRFHNYNEYFNSHYKNTYNIDFNKNDINFNYILLNIYKCIDSSDIQKFIYDFKKDFNTDKDKYLYSVYINFGNKYKYDTLSDILKLLYFDGDDEGVRYLQDYIYLCKNNKSKIRIKNIKNIKKLHDKEMEKQLLIKKKSLKQKFNYQDSKFKYLIKNMPDKYTLIKNEFSLWEEGQVQHNCVYTYKDKIVSDRCIIYKYLKGNNAHYTIEIRVDNNGKYILYQIKNSYNNDPNVIDLEEVKNDIEYINQLKEAV